MSRNKLRGIIAETGHSVTSLAKEIGMSRNTLSAKLNGKSPFTIDEVKQICKALEISDLAELATIFLP